MSSVECVELVVSIDMIYILIQDFMCFLSILVPNLAGKENKHSLYKRKDEEE